MKRLKKFQPVMIIVLILNFLIACSNDQEELFLEDQNENTEEVVEYVAATIYYEEQDGDKHAIVYTTEGDKKVFTNGKKVEETKERAPKPVRLPDHVDNPKHSEIIEDESWTDEEAMDQTTPDIEVDTNPDTEPEAETTPDEESQTISPEVQYWKDMFDAEWVESDKQLDEQDAISRSLSKNKNQEYYFLAYYIDGLTQVWQATGDNNYLDTALTLINNTINDAVDVGNGFKGWPAADGVEYALWDSYYWRYVATIVRIMDQSPNLRVQKDYQQQYEKLLAFSEQHIWNRYESKGVNNFYRINTHMSSHWARIGMELYIVTGNPKYKEVFDNISYGQMVNRPSNLRERLYANPNSQSSYVWDQRWDVSHGANVQDTSHAGAIISFWITAYENGMYWDQSDINALTSTLNNVVWPNGSGANFYKFVDGTGGYDLPGRLHEWLTLGRYDVQTQQKIKNEYVFGNNLEFFGTQVIGIAALNEKIQMDGKPVYPEQF